jgi:REP element-mobilizing transposase RayT
VPPSNSRFSAQVAAITDPESSSDSKAGRGGKPSKDPATAGNGVHFEPFEQRAYDMSYACLLIPRNPEHLLTGKISDFIHKIVRDTCDAFGWRLTLIQVRPQYIQWVVNATVGTPPSKCIHTIRDQTSKGILDKFKQFRDKVPYQDFWAPGYLVLVSKEAHPQSIIDEFINLTRQQQRLPRQGA